MNKYCPILSVLHGLRNNEARRHQISRSGIAVPRCFRATLKSSLLHSATSHVKKFDAAAVTLQREEMPANRLNEIAKYLFQSCEHRRASIVQTISDWMENRSR